MSNYFNNVILNNNKIEPHKNLKVFIILVFYHMIMYRILKNSTSHIIILLRQLHIHIRHGKCNLY
jgi:hypothetical protein